MLRRSVLSAAVGSLVFAFLSPLIWGWYVSAFVVSAVAGGIIGCVSAGIGECTFLLVKRRGHKGILDYVIHGFLALVAVILGLLVGGFLGYMSPLLVWTVIDQFHPEAKFPGDIVSPIVACLGALLALTVSLLHASGAVQSG
ncbi:MAG: hypothetical protein Q7T82_17375 [Armatimonadota bacterium]|nr:hypothetical protein [Armatimonadota bacterium]